MLKDGETRKLRKPSYSTLDISVTAERIDSDTPIVILSVPIGLDCFDIFLTDIDTHDLIKLLQRALSILPTSK